MLDKIFLNKKYKNESSLIMGIRYDFLSKIFAIL
jgi:hypothetical protein